MKKQLNVSVSPITIEQVHDIQKLTGESQATLIVRLVAEEHARLENRQGKDDGSKNGASS